MPANAAANRYELKERLGEGGMGVVYRALDTRTNSFVALKTLRDSTDPNMLEMFKREWAELGKVPHPNIVDVRDVDEIEENGIRKPCFIMPLLPGCTLAALIKSSSPRLTTEFVVNMVSQVCKGLQAAHEKDLIHRDLKPSNIFIMEDDTAKIIDFGLVYTVGHHSATTLKGTWQYMPQEQIDGSKQPNRSFDIYSLGVVAYEALTGYQPFKRAKFDDTVEAVRHFVPQAISERNPKVPQMVSKAVHVAMAKLPIHRYATAREFAETIQRAHQNQYIERFDPAKIRPRIERAKKAFSNGDSDFASEILTELEAEGNLDTDITLLRSQIDEYNKQKRIRQLFEAVQTRLEQDEIPLALEKLDEIFKLDPQNPEAAKLRKRIEQERSQQQASEWLDLARKHLARHDFAEARRALKEVFNLRYDDPDAARLKTQVDNREKEVETARAEKEHLYSFALRHNQNGEISSALSKLEKLLELSRNLPGASVPERDKVFQTFYNDVRSERDRIENAYSEGTRHLSEKNFAKAFLVCDGILGRYPQNPQFQALRLKIEHASRQELSAYIAEVGRAVDTEPNLDRRVGLLEEACRRYPNEEQFARQLSLARELRDLVASIVARARTYEEQGQFTEAIAQWKTLSNIHPQYPGIDFEISQLERRREQQTEEDKKSRLVSRIDRALGNAAYADAERLSQEGLLEFAQDPELLALLRLARQGLDQTREAERVFEEAKTHRDHGNFDQAAALFRQALDLDHRNIVILNTLVNFLVERAHALLATNAPAAEPLAAEAAHLDPDHPSVKKLISLIAEAKRKQDVEETIVQVRGLQSTNRQQAIDLLKRKLTEHVGDARLQQTLYNLQKDEPRAFAASAAAGSAPEETIVYPLSQTQRSPQSASPKKNVAPPIAPAPPKFPWHARGKRILQQLRDAGDLFVQNVRSRLEGHSRKLLGVVIGLLGSLLVIGFGYWIMNRHSENGSTGGAHPITALAIPIQTSPADALVTLDGNLVSGTSPQLEKGSLHHIVVSHVGYQTIENSTLEVTGKPWEFALSPYPLHISVSVSEPNGSVWLDDQRVGNLDEGTWSGIYPFKTAQEQHVLSAKGPTGDLLFKISYSVAPGKPASVAALRTKDLLVSSSLGKDAIVYAGNSATSLGVADQPRKPIPAEGLSVNTNEAAGTVSIDDGKKVRALALAGNQAPALSILLNASPKLVAATISVDPKNANLSVDGGPMQAHNKKPGVWTWMAAPGAYEAKLTAKGMVDERFTITLKKGVSFDRHVEMKPLKPIGPAPATLTVSGGNPGATVSIDDSPVGQLDDNGAISFAGVVPGSHRIQLSLRGYGSRTFYGVAFTSGKTSDLLGDKRLTPETGFARIIVTPANVSASVSYKRAGESEKHPVADLNKALTLPPDTYQFIAEAPKYQQAMKEVKIKANQTSSVGFDLVPAPIVEQKAAFIDPDEVIHINGDWYHGRTNNFLHLLTNSRTNTLFLSKEFKLKKMSWRVYLDGLTITYTLDSKGVAIVNNIEGEESTDRVKDVDLSSTDNPSKSYAATIKLEKNEVILTRQDGTVIARTHDDRHDWTHARLFVKGDTYFTFWPGR
jgi:serine/threonine-protein kinase